MRSTTGLSSVQGVRFAGLMVCWGLPAPMTSWAFWSNGVGSVNILGTRLVPGARLEACCSTLQAQRMLHVQVAHTHSHTEGMPACLVLSDAA